MSIARIFRFKSIVLNLNFFFSSRRRHTRSLCDWSSDVCSSDLPARWRRRLDSVRDPYALRLPDRQRILAEGDIVDPWRSEERRVGKSVDLGGCWMIKTKKMTRKDKMKISGAVYGCGSASIKR